MALKRFEKISKRNYQLFYRKDACMYDKSIKYAMSSINCLPLSLQDDSASVTTMFRTVRKVCSPWNQMRFFELVRSMAGDFKEACPTACNKNIYTLEIVKRFPIEQSNYYQDFSFIGRDILPYIYLYTNNISSYSENIPSNGGKGDEDGPFIGRMKRMAGLHITFKHPVYAKVIKDIRVGTQDKVAIIGGILGLFTGFSIVSLVEGAYWLYLACSQRFFNFHRKVAALNNTA